MSRLVIHRHTQTQLDHLAANPVQALLMIGPAGIGKAAVANRLAEQILGLPDGGLSKYPHVRIIRPVDNKAIGIEPIRELEHFLSLKIPGSKPIARIVIIEDSHLLTAEAQNALLKTLEEPPDDAVLLLTAAYEQALLPTIRSRVQILPIHKPAEEQLASYFTAVDPNSFRQALAISGGLPGLMAALLNEDAEHPLVEAVRYAKELLQTDTYQRLLKVDELAKRKDFARDTCRMLSHMAQLAITKNDSWRWQRILKASYEADKALAGSAQPKLVLTQLMLQL